MTHMYPRLVVKGAAQAIDFYAKAFGAKEISRYTDESTGRIHHAELELAGTTFAVKDEGDGDPAPPTLGGSPVVMALYVDDADAVGQRMEENGATVVFPIKDQPYGDRGGRLADPFGHLWMIAQPLGRIAPADAGPLVM
ncbi:VOC family protein [Phytohabitans flavus]|uniref:Glyoxalase n=1 Tax=Phytohabitans flavus TaxID=1076124 RepID=A0A6F8XT97_9ACTN|nr:VOC family protein [Phytohabitans flavus]BCB77017.1 glyoxalase [Phytohabitans flavus]